MNTQRGDRVQGIKVYHKPKGVIFSTVYDMIELQHGEIILSDTGLGRLHYQVSMYNYVWELLFIVTETGYNKSTVSLRVVGERKDKAREIRRQFSLLDSMLDGGTDVKITECV